MRFGAVLCACALILAASRGRADEDRDRARAALELAKAKAAAAQTVAVVASPCLEDIDQARKLAAEKKKPLIVWVVITCKDHTDVRKALPDCIHCHVGALNEDKTPRIVLNGPDGTTYRIPAEEVTVPNILWHLGRGPMPSPRQAPMPAPTTGSVWITPAGRGVIRSENCNT